MGAGGALSTCWVVTDGKAGMESQCVGLAEALGLSAVVKRVVLRAPWRQLSPYLRLGHAHAFAAKGDTLAPPWPDLLIASGRLSIAASLFVREQSRGSEHRTITVQVQDPVISPSNFDLVIAPQHDRLTGRNVISTLGALHRITPTKLAEHAEKLAARLQGMPRPYLGVLLGGSNGAYRFGEHEMAALAASLVSVAKTTGGSLLITPSRRTGESNMKVLESVLGDTPAYIWNGEGENPYFGILGLADQIVVTGDSINMVSEAVATGKPVHVFALPGGSDKFNRFHDAMRERGLTHALAGRLEAHHPAKPDDDMARAADAVRRVATEIRGC